MQMDKLLENCLEFFCLYTARIIRDILDTYVTELHYDIYDLE